MSSQSSATGRRRSNISSRQYSAEDQALNMISKEAEARLAAKRAARAEAREIRMKEIEKQQKQSEDTQDRLYELTSDHAAAKVRSVRQTLSGSRRGSTDSTDSASDAKDVDFKAEIRELEEKYKSAMMTSAQLDNEKQSLVYQVELLKDQLEEQDEGYTELQRDYKDKCRECDFQKRDLKSLEYELSILKQQLEIKDRLIEESGFVIMANDKGEPVLERQSSDSAGARASSNGPLPTGAFLVSPETKSFLENAGEGTLGTCRNPTGGFASPEHCSTKPSLPSVEASALCPSSPDQAEGQRVLHAPSAVITHVVCEHEGGLMGGDGDQGKPEEASQVEEAGVTNCSLSGQKLDDCGSIEVEGSGLGAEGIEGDELDNAGLAEVDSGIIEVKDPGYPSDHVPLVSISPPPTTKLSDGDESDDGDEFFDAESATLSRFVHSGETGFSFPQDPNEGSSVDDVLKPMQAPVVTDNNTGLQSLVLENVTENETTTDDVEIPSPLDEYVEKTQESSISISEGSSVDEEVTLCSGQDNQSSVQKENLADQASQRMDRCPDLSQHEEVEIMDHNVAELDEVKASDCNKSVLEVKPTGVPVDNQSVSSQSQSAALHTQEEKTEGIENEPVENDSSVHSSSQDDPEVNYGILPLESKEKVSEDSLESTSDVLDDLHISEDSCDLATGTEDSILILKEVQEAIEGNLQGSAEELEGLELSIENPSNVEEAGKESEEETNESRISDSKENELVHVEEDKVINESLSSKNEETDYQGHALDDITSKLELEECAVQVSKQDEIVPEIACEKIEEVESVVSSLMSDSLSLEPAYEDSVTTRVLQRGTSLESEGGMLDDYDFDDIDDVLDGVVSSGDSNQGVRDPVDHNYPVPSPRKSRNSSSRASLEPQELTEAGVKSGSSKISLDFDDDAMGTLNMLSSQAQEPEGDYEVALDKSGSQHSESHDHGKALDMSSSQASLEPRDLEGALDKSGSQASLEPREGALDKSGSQASLEPREGALDKSGSQASLEPRDLEGALDTSGSQASLEPHEGALDKSGSQASLEPREGALDKSGSQASLEPRDLEGALDKSIKDNKSRDQKKSKKFKFFKKVFK